MPREPVFFVRVTAGGAPQIQSGLVPVVDDYFTWQWPWARRPAAHRMRLGLREKLHPLLIRWLVDSLATRQELLVTFVDTIPMPSLAGLDSSQARARIEKLILRRSDAFHGDTLGYSGLFGTQTLDRFWITQTLLMRVPMSRLQAMAQRPEVMYVRPRLAGEGPPTQGPNDATGDDIVVGGDQLGVSNYLLWNLIPLVSVSPSIFRPWISLLDTGVRMTHEMLSASSGVTIRCGDCVHGGEDCHQSLDGSALQDDCAVGHGTSTAAILVGRPGPDERHTGLTLDKIDSYKVYVPGPGHCGLQVDAAAAKRGFEAALGLIDPVSGPMGRVILAEIAADETSWGDCARAADHAYDLGRQVLAATGDAGQVGTVGAPANARKAIGVGAYHIVTGRSLTAESLGPTSPDGRIKPDIQAPSVAEAAGNGGDDDYHTFSGTSGALPFAGAATALMAGVWESFGRDLEPGHLNALLILSGRQSYPFDNTPVTTNSPDHPHGAGHLRLPDLNALGVGSCFLIQTPMGGETKEVELDAPPATSSIEVALWWADSLADESGAVVHMHSRVDALIIDPAGVERATSTHPTSVFQRCTATGITPGTWRLRLTAHEMREQPLPEGGTVRGQKIYWAATLRGP